jgi:hypothetical protein
MGFAPKEKRVELINSYISELKTERERLKEVRSSYPDTETIIENYITFLKESGKHDTFKKVLQSDSLSESLRDITLFQFATLELGIEKADFEINWFERFVKRLEDSGDED